MIRSYKKKVVKLSIILFVCLTYVVITHKGEEVIITQQV